MRRNNNNTSQRKKLTRKQDQNFEPTIAIHALCYYEYENDDIFVFNPNFYTKSTRRMQEKCLLKGVWQSHCFDIKGIVSLGIGNYHEKREGKLRWLNGMNMIEFKWY